MTYEKPHIKFGIPDQPLTRALLEGKVEIDGYELEFNRDPITPGEIHYRFVQGQFDVADFSAATFLRTREKNDRFLALPVFLARGPRQRNIFYSEGSLQHPSELKGKKIGCFRYGATAVVWARGFLLDEYNLKTTDMEWYVSGREVYIGRELPVKVERLDPSPPFGQEKPHLSRLLREGVLQAAIVAGDNGYKGIFGGGSLPKVMGASGGVRSLFEDEDEIIRYIRKTRIYPIIHTIAMNRELAERYPDLPAKIIQAFREAKRLCANYLSAGELAGYEKEIKVLEEDPYAFVLGETERRAFKTLMRYQIEQGLMKKELPLESLFVRAAYA